MVGNSDGVGLALTRQLVAAGWTVAGLSRSASDLAAPGYARHVADVTGDTYRTVLAGVRPARRGRRVCLRGGCR